MSNTTETKVKMNVDSSDAHPDPISGELGAHPVGVGLGAVGAGALAGAAGGAIAGPIGMVAGVAIGAVAGGLAGKAAAEAVNPTEETLYWREYHPVGPYASHMYGYDEYAPAYRYGWESFDRHGDKLASFDSMEAELGLGWSRARGKSQLVWDQARHATRDAWNRVQRTAKGNLKSRVV